MFRIHKGKTHMEDLPVTTSTTFSKGALVAWSSGLLIEAVSGTAKESIVGIITKAVTAADSDYAVARKIAVIVPSEKGVEVEADVTSGLVAADKGLFQDLTDALTVNRAASSVDVVQCIKVLSTTKGIFKLNIGGAGA